MKFIVKASTLSGSATIPGNKSGTARGIIFGSLAEGVSTLVNPLTNLDSFSIVNMMRALGAKIDTSDNTKWIIEGTGGTLAVPACVLDAENSGTGFYFVLALCSLIPGYSVLTGDYQICYRPAQPMLDAINALGGKAFSTRGTGSAPVVVKGPIKGGRVSLPGVNSQWMTPFLCACALAEGDTTIEETDLLERPYVDMTIGMLKIAGIEVENRGYDEFFVRGNQKFKAFTYTLPGDWGSSGYPMIASAITKGSKVTFKGLDLGDFAGETAFVQILKDMGASVTVIDNGRGGIVIEGGNPLQGITIDCSGTPDAVPILAVLGCYAQGKTVLENIGACRLKETDRAKSIKEELTKMGARFEETPDSLTIYHSHLHGTAISGHHDHRIVMASTVAALIAEGTSEIENAEYAAVSFPNFFELMTSLNADIQCI
ncbi:3-phosphoshikimate 1-carboxyvinyltransferase [Sphaerochaeta pleomorpha str. Grapes]|uniref:3-phosphoshikimate 1-carboxyvinyltransferase n=1 Tax=Sphaerochaeta pleomorpha (strain ATCC BAA-1885 / DSM 22778 / Grapes) TaxID=158190 RepID=G8QYR4_SPHPG|nr:3-phosphoshikimate 1-carboxyvinyltransferase [Sphaerochaeta pleomorpha]AEV29691.1 3-phosphoshikimate 1-carboxyvinyltransferase [Sphaerochaeta pleomorpha str. Grapes]